MSGSSPIVLMEGFDHLSAAQMSTKNWVETHSGGMNAFGVTTGLLGTGQCLRLGSGGNNGTATFRKTTTFTGISSFSVGFRYRFNGTIIGLAALNSPEILQLLTTVSSGRVASIQLQSDGFFRILNAAGSIVATGTNLYVNNTVVHLELTGTVATSGVTLTLYVNGTQEAQATNVNTGSSNVVNIMFNASHVSASGAGTDDFDDVYVSSSATHLGDLKVEVLNLNAEGTNTAWPANTGTKVAAIDQTTSYDSDTDFISSSTPGDRQTFTASALSIAAGPVYAVQTNIVARKDDAGTRQVADTVRQGSTNYDGNASIGLSASYIVYSQIHDQDPTGTDWTVTTINGNEYGVSEVV